MNLCKFYALQNPRNWDLQVLRLCVSRHPSHMIFDWLLKIKHLLNHSIKTKIKVFIHNVLYTHILYLFFLNIQWFVFNILLYTERWSVCWCSLLMVLCHWYVLQATVNPRWKCCPYCLFEFCRHMAFCMSSEAGSDGSFGPNTRVCIPRTLGIVVANLWPNLILMI